MKGDVRTPRVSIVVRIYDAERYVREAIESALAQTFADFELIAVVDGSTDASLDIVRSFGDARIRIVCQANAGRAAAADRGLAEARGEFVAVLDADDRWAADHLQLHVDALERDDALALVGAATRVVDPAGTVIGARTYPLTDGAIRRVALLYNPFAHSAIVMRRAIALAAGGYDRTQAHEDYGLWLRMLKRGKGANLAAFSCDYRVSVRATSARLRYMLLGTIDVRKTAFSQYGYARTLSTRGVDAALAVLARVPPRLVERIFRLLFYRGQK